MRQSLQAFFCGPCRALPVAALLAGLPLACGGDESDDEDTSAAGAAGTAAEGDTATPGAAAEMTFFVTSETNPTGNLGGIAGADAKCERLAEAVGAGDHTWRAYLSAENDGSGQPVHAG